MALTTQERVTLQLRLSEPLRLFPHEKGPPSGSVVTLEISPWVARNYTAQISIGKSGVDTTNAHSQKRVKQLLGGRLSLRNYNAQVGETYAMIKALNKLTRSGMPETCRID